MGACCESSNIRSNEGGKGHAPVPIFYTNQLRKTICKINYISYHGTGFFMLLNDKIKVLLTNYHIIS